MDKNKSVQNKAKLFDIHHFPMDLGRIVSSSMPLWFRLRKIYVSDTAKEKIRNGALIAANHTNFYDPLMLGCCFWYRRMFFLTAEVVMQKITELLSDRKAYEDMRMALVGMAVPDCAERICKIMEELICGKTKK